MSCTPLILWQITTNEIYRSYILLPSPRTPVTVPGTSWSTNLGVWKQYTNQFNLITSSQTTTLWHTSNEYDANCLKDDIIDTQAAIINQVLSTQNQLNSSISNSTGTVLFGMEQYNNVTASNISDAELAIMSGINAATVAMGVDLLNQGNSIRYNIGYDNDITRDEINSAMFNATSVINNNVIENRSLIDDIGDGIIDTFNSALGGVSDSIDFLGGGITWGLSQVGSDITNTINALIDTILNPLLALIERIVNALEKIVTDVLTIPFKIIGDFQEFWISRVKLITDGLGDEFGRWDNIRDELLSGNFNTWDEMLTAFDEGSTDADLLGFGLGLLQLIPFIYRVSGLLMHPMVANLELLAQEKAGVALLNPGEVVESYKRGDIDIQSAIEELGLSGYQEERIRIILLLARQLFGVGEISQLFLRGFIDESENDDRLQALGYEVRDRVLLKELYHVMPSVQDLVLMAVREVFTPDIADKFGLFEDYPPAFAENAAKIGLSDEWSRNYWAAHWTLPSIMQGFTMMHRRVITQDELKMLLRAQDVMPFWRDKLVDISFNPLTRVDVRRMHDTGVLNRKQVYDAYLDVGFNAENAERMTEFTIRYNADDVEGSGGKLKELTRSVIQSAYKKGVISKVDALARLQELGYGIADSQLLLDLLDYEEQLNLLPDEKKQITVRLNTLTVKAYTSRAISKIEATDTLKDSGYSGVEIEALLTTADLEHDLDFKAEIISTVKQLYFDETIDVLDLRVILEGNDFVPDEIDMLVGELNVFKFLRGRKLTRADLRKAFNGKVIDLDEYTKELAGLGYPDKYIAIILQNDGAISRE